MPTCVYVKVNRPEAEVVTMPVWPDHSCAGAKWIVAPAHAPACCVRAASAIVAVLTSVFGFVTTVAASMVALAGRETSRVVLGQRASIIILPSRNTWLPPRPRSHDWGGL